MAVGGVEIILLNSLKEHIVCFRAGYQQHAEEDDPERLTQIIERSVEDAEWIVKKYTKN